MKSDMTQANRMSAMLFGRALRDMLAADPMDQKVLEVELVDIFRAVYMDVPVPPGEHLVDQFDWESIDLPRYDQ